MPEVGTVIRAPEGAEREKEVAQNQTRGGRSGRVCEANHRETAEITVLHQIWCLEGYLEVRIEQSFGSLTFGS